jgi:hypothetical protein
VKAEARKARAIERERNKGLFGERAIKEAAKFLKGWTQQDLDALATKYGKDIAPHEVSKRIATEMLAFDVRKKLAADNADHDLGFPAEVIASINEHTVVEILEGLVEGDNVIDDAATHQWFRNKLDKYRDLCIDFDNKAKEMEVFATVIGLRQALSGDFDVLIDTVPDAKPGTVGVIANEAARAALSGCVQPDHWSDLPPLPEWSAWKQTFVTFDGSEGPPKNPIKFFADTIANNSSLRVGIVRKYGSVDPVSAEAA